ncbi:unnamed protein product [Chilo suppressalis]|uniref:Uncharacterized protein n=1 Tax=Chilo suppressalis TaxID=168631 RepID=A0ABN8BCX7_CHISP|nr:unnamed protein product [Chilo suppressalis]
MIQVYQKAFLQILQIKRYRVENVIKNYHLYGNFPTEKRGGDHKSHKYKDKKENIIKFIKTFKCSEVHYCRGYTKRMYLPPELSINKMAKMYNDQAPENLKVKELYFRTVFNTCFNLGFGSLQHNEKLKIALTDSDKSILMAEKTVHKRRAKEIFKMLKEDNRKIKILNFDCQKNMPLPKIPDQSNLSQDDDDCVLILALNENQEAMMNNLQDQNTQFTGRGTCRKEKEQYEREDTGINSEKEDFEFTFNHMVGEFLPHYHD